MSWGLQLLGNVTSSLLDVAGNVSLHGYEGLFTPRPLTSWRVTPDSPVRYSSSLDVERCAALHNEILWHGWNGSGNKVEDFPGVNWFHLHGADARKARPRLSSPVSAFLDQALAINGSASTHSFFYHVGGLHWPAGMWENHEMLQQFADKDRYLTLYSAHSRASHSDGLVYDQQNHKAIMQPSIFDSDVTMNERQKWEPLEVILTAWLDMIEVGRVQAVTEDVRLPNEKFDPWIMHPYSQKELNNTITAFDKLTYAIEMRMPSRKAQLEEEQKQRVLGAPQPNSAHDTLLSPDDLDTAKMKPGFAYSFLTTVRRPRFRYIAPGLSLPTPKSIKYQPFADVKQHEQRPDWQRDYDEQEDPDFEEEHHPFLLFSSSPPDQHHYESWRDPPDDPRFPYGHRPFAWPYAKLDAFPAGLYLSPFCRGHAYEFEGTARLVLPFPVGGFGYARTADGALLSEQRWEKGPVGRVVGKGTFADLFQLGYVPFGLGHDVQLEKVLDAWRGLVESGEWTIGEDGVVDSITKWKDADTYRKRDQYTVPLGW